MARKQYPLRIDPAIWEAVQRWADDEMRSANGQVEWILRDALKRAGRLPKKEGRSKGTRNNPIRRTPSARASAPSVYPNCQSHYDWPLTWHFQAHLPT